MKSLFRSLVLTVLALPAFASVAHSQFTYTFYPTNTTINSDVNTDLSIVGYVSGSYDEDFNRNFVSPSSPTVQIVDGANIVGEVDIFNSSIVNLSGGYAAFLIGYDNSTVNITGGQSDFVLSIDQVVINMIGGHISDLEGQGQRINVTGGLIDTLVANTNTDAPGNSLGSCIVDVTGGSIGELDSFNDGILNFRGGSVTNRLEASFGGTINFFGSGFTATLLNPNVNNRFSQYSVSGILADGSVLNSTSLFIENEGVTYGHSSFNFISVAPEPGSLAFAACGGLTAVGLLRRRKRG